MKSSECNDSNFESDPLINREPMQVNKQTQHGTLRNLEELHKVSHSHERKHLEFWQIVYGRINMNEANSVLGHRCQNGLLALRAGKMIDSVKSSRKFQENQHNRFPTVNWKSNFIVNPDESCLRTVISTIRRLKHFTWAISQISVNVINQLQSHYFFNNFR